MIPMPVEEPKNSESEADSQPESATTGESAPDSDGKTEVVIDTSEAGTTQPDRTITDTDITPPIEPKIGVLESTST